MKRFNRLIFLFYVVLLLLFPEQFIPVVLRQSSDTFQLVESVPEETVFEESQFSRTYDVWLDMINKAERSIDIETFYVSNMKGEVLEKIFSSLKDAAGRGVKIRIIVDLSFYELNDNSVDFLENIPNITIRKIDFKDLAGGVMHAKYFITDKENIFIGSQNMDWRAVKHIHELGVRIRDRKICAMFCKIFESDWGLYENKKSDVFADLIMVNSVNPVLINSDFYGEISIYPAFSPISLIFPDYENEEEQLLKIIRRTKRKLFVQVYSYSLRADNEEGYYDRIDEELRKAASRGVKIKIILPDWAIKKSAIQDIQDLSTVRNIEIKFITIPQHSSGFIPYARVDHCKYFVSDDRVSVISTSNWEWGYFYTSRNATLIISNKKVNQQLTKLFAGVWKGPYVKMVDPYEQYEPVRRK